MTKYERAKEIVHEAYDGLITNIIANIDITRANLRISENEFRNTLAFLLDEAYYFRNISDNPPDHDIASIIFTRLRSSLPDQDIQQVNIQRYAVLEEIDNANLNTEREIYSSLNAYIFQSGIAINVDITNLRDMINRGDSYDSIIKMFLDLGSMLPAPALRTNLDLYYRDLQIANNRNEELIQSIIDFYIIDTGEEEVISDNSTDIYSIDDYSNTEESEGLIGLAEAFSYNYCNF